jgi:DNA invertase Pin-like site-specific DNA recombinase
MTIEIEDRLCRMSVATIDRLLRPWKRKGGRRSLATTRAGSFLRSAIPIRTFADWQENRPGFIEADLVAHCGESSEGFYLNTLMAVDVATGWSEFIGVWGKGQQRVGTAVHHIRQRLPFPLRGLDSDNGSEFINHDLAGWCQREGITFTRSRPYKKNDNCIVEQKNGSIVRRVIGYDRYSSKQALEVLNRTYYLLRVRELLPADDEQTGSEGKDNSHHSERCGGDSFSGAKSLNVTGLVKVQSSEWLPYAWCPKKSPVSSQAFWWKCSGREEMLTVTEIIKARRKHTVKPDENELRRLPCKRARIYGRVSTPSQIRDSRESIREIARLIELAKQDGDRTNLQADEIEKELLGNGSATIGLWEDGEVTVDVRDLGLSGQLGAENRIGLADLQRSVKEGVTGAVYLTEGVSRLSRDRDHVLPYQLLKLLKEHKCRVRTPEGVWNPAIERDWEYLADEFEGAIDEKNLMNKRLHRRKAQEASRGEFVGEPVLPGFILPITGRKPNGQYEYGKLE